MRLTVLARVLLLGLVGALLPGSVAYSSADPVDLKNAATVLPKPLGGPHVPISPAEKEKIGLVEAAAKEAGVSEQSFFFSNGILTGAVQSETQASILDSFHISHKMTTYSFEELKRTCDKVASLLIGADIGIGAPLIAVDVATSRVVVSITSAQANLDVVRQALSLPGVILEYVDEAALRPVPAAEDVAAGLRMNIGGGFCTMGFPTWNTDYMFTAGHCSRALGTSVTNGAGKWIGRTYSSHIKNDSSDWGLIDLGAVTTKLGYVANWNGGYNRITGRHILSRMILFANTVPQVKSLLAGTLTWHI